VGAEGDDVIGADHALIAEAEAAGKIETRRERKSDCASRAGMAKRWL